MRKSCQPFWLLFTMLIFVACGQDGEEVATPTLTMTPAIIEETPTATAVPTNTATHTPEPIPTDTAVPEPTITPTQTAIPEAELTATAVAQPTDLIIHQPRTLTELAVGQEITINGELIPPQAADVEIRLTVAGGEELLAATAVADAVTGLWSVTAVVPPEIVGPAEVEAWLANGVSSTNQITLIPDDDSEQTMISITSPQTLDTAVVGYTLLFEGRVTNPIDETVTIAILDNDCTTTAASQSFSVPGGSWFGFTIISANAEPGPACAIASTGSHAAGNGREYRIPLNLVSPDDPAALILEMGLTDEIQFKAGHSTYLFGVAVNAPENAVMIKLESDDPSRPSEIITSATAFTNQYGFWEIDLEIPENAGGGAILLVTSGNNDENYREIRLPTIIQE